MYKVLQCFQMSRSGVRRSIEKFKESHTVELKSRGRRSKISDYRKKTSGRCVYRLQNNYKNH